MGPDPSSPVSSSGAISRGSSGGSNYLQFVRYTGAGGDGASIERVVDLSSQSGNTLLQFDLSRNGIGNGETLTVEYYNGTSWTTLETYGNGIGGTNGSTGAQSIDLTGLTHVANSEIRFAVTQLSGSSNYFHVDNVAVVNVPQGTDVTVHNQNGGTLVASTGDDIVLDSGGSHTINALAGKDIINGGSGDDIIDAGDDDDLILWTQTGNFSNDGHDRVNGGAGTDTFRIQGNNSSETYRLYTMGDSLSGHSSSGLDTSNEIVVTRQSGFFGGESVIAELKSIEEINLRLGGGSDTVIPSGNFDETLLSYNTITVDGGSGADTIDLSLLTSDHRTVYTGDGGRDTIIGGNGGDVLDGGKGADTISGGAGDDTLTGGKGKDTFVFAPGFGTDTITDFDANPANGQDHIDLTAFDGLAAKDLGVSPNSDIWIQVIGGNTYVHIDNDTIKLLGVNGVGNNVITADDFLFV